RWRGSRRAARISLSAGRLRRAARRRIFLSYRRSDSMSASGRLYERLAAQYSRANVFKDIDSIPGAADFRAAILQTVSQCALHRVVSGQHWLEARDERGRRRLDNPADLVRLEIEAALENDVPVMPVLVEGASMPPKAMLPQSLQQLAARQAVVVNN